MRLRDLPPGIRELAQAARRAEQEAIDTFVSAIGSLDPEAAVTGLRRMEAAGCLKAGFRLAAKLDRPSDDFRRAFLQVWMRSGDHLRCELGDDLLLVTALRVLLPRYSGPAITLYRGDSAWNRSRRTYGMSWSTDLEVAKGFAEGMWRTFQGGSVALQTLAPPDAILCAVTAHHEDRYGELEYLVDRRRLGRVEVVKRFGQIGIDEHQRRSAEFLKE